MENNRQSILSQIYHMNLFVLGMVAQANNIQIYSQPLLDKSVPSITQSETVFWYSVFLRRCQPCDRLLSTVYKKDNSSGTLLKAKTSNMRTWYATNVFLLSVTFNAWSLTLSVVPLVSGLLASLSASDWLSWDCSKFLFFLLLSYLFNIFLCSLYW